MRYFIAFLMFCGVWCVGTVLIWFCTVVFASPRYDEAVLIGLPTDWRNITSNIIAAIVGFTLAIVYLRRAQKRIPG